MDLNSFIEEMKYKFYQSGYDLVDETYYNTVRDEDVDYYFDRCFSFGCEVYCDVFAQTKYDIVILVANLTFKNDNLQYCDPFFSVMSQQ